MTIDQNFFKGLARYFYLGFLSFSYSKIGHRVLSVVLILLMISALSLSPLGIAQGREGGDLDKPFGEVKGITGLANAIFKLGIILCVLVAAIYIVIGGFAYFAAAGNAEMAERGKKIISRSIIGLILALIAWIILNTIHPQFAGGLKEPHFQSGQ